MELVRGQDGKPNYLADAVFFVSMRFLLKDGQLLQSCDQKERGYAAAVRMS